jgi:hypothetical protein
MAVFQYEGIGSLRSLGNRFTIQRAVYSYSKFSILNYEELDYGSISDPVAEAEDYGEITASIEQYYQIQDFGTITLNTAGIPMGKIGIHLSATDSETRVSVGGIQFALFGRAATEVLFNPVNRVFDFQGIAVNRISSSWLGKGILSTPQSEVVDAVGSTPPTSTLRLTISGEGKEEVIFNELDRVFDLIGEAEESRTYQYDQDDDIDFDSDDWGFLTEPVLRSENYGLIAELQDIPIWDYSNIEDWGLITENTTTKVYGRTKFSGGIEERFIFANYEGSVGNKQPRLLGTALDRATPRHAGEGHLLLRGNPVVGIIIHYKADGGWDFYPQRFRGGSLFGFSDTADTTAVLNEGTGKLFSIKSGTTFKAVRSEVGVSEEDVLIRGGAVYEVIFNQIDRVFSFSNLEINRRAYAYNLSSVVNIESIDYGFITETVTLSEDYGDVGNHDLVYPWDKEDFGTLAPTETRLPFGLTRFYSTTETPRVRRFVGNQENTHLRLVGNAKVYVLPQFRGGGTVTLTSTYTESRTNDEVGEGRLYGFSGAADAVAFIPAKDDRALFNIEGQLIEKFGKGNYDGSGSIFGFEGSAESTLVSDSSSGLFKFAGNVVEKSIFREVFGGSLFGFDSASETRTFAYNTSSSYGACDGEDYGFITEPPYNTGAPVTISTYASTTISTLGSEVVSEFGGVLNAIDYGLVNQYYQYNHEDYGNLHPDDCIEPFGFFNFVDSGIEKFGKGNYTGTGSLFAFVGGTEEETNIHIGSGGIKLSGEKLESVTPATEIGSGSIFSFVSFTETATFSENTPQPLFAIDGGLRISAVNEQESELKFTAAWNGSGSLFKISETDFARVRIFTGGGSISIRDSGLRIEPESFTPWIPAGQGSIFSFVSFTETAAFSEQTPQPLFTFSGAATDIQFSFAWATTTDSQIRVIGNAEVYVLPKHIGSGSFFVRTSGVRIEPESFTPWIPAGSGRLFGFGSGAESKIVNPPDQTTLFTITGQSEIPLLTFSEERFVQARFLPDEAFTVFKLRVTETGLQPIEIHGVSTESTTPAPHVATGTLFGFSSTTESQVINPPDQTTLFSFSGSALESDTNVEVGSGTIFSFVSKTESKAVSEVKTSLFTFSGSLEESTSPAPHVATGSLFGFSSTTESRVINPPDQTTLFSFNGNAVEKSSIAEVGEGDPGLDINGSLVERKTNAHLATGSLFGFSSTTESRVIVPPNLQNLFTVNGDVDDSLSVVEIGTGSIFGFVGASESKSNVEFNITLFELAGNSIVRFAGANEAVGQIRVGLSNPGIPGDISRGITVFRLRTFPQGPVVKFVGTKAESFTPAPHISEGLIDIDAANTESRYVEYARPQPTRIIVI